jgi:diaminopimelate decarboxylase
MPQTPHTPPIPPRLLEAIAAEHGTPCYVYDAATIRARLAALRDFDVIRYAQKACSNIHVLHLVREAGALVDAVSLGELERALRAGFQPGRDPADIVYTADLIDEATLERVVELGVPVNAGSADMLSRVGERRSGHPVWLRVNPGFGHGHSRKTSTGGDTSKHGIWYEALEDALRRIDRHGLDLVGLHMHIGSGTDFHHLKQVCDAMVGQVRAVGRDLRAISGGGGLPVPYRGGESGLDAGELFRLWDGARRRIEDQLGHRVQLEIEPGRFVVAEAGVLLARVHAIKEQGKNRFWIVDAGFNDLVRPAMYGAYHGISLVREGRPVTGATHPTLVGGPLCESGDVFTQEEGGVVTPRALPDARLGDLAVLHTAGAYAASMASNYNTRPLAPEVLVQEDGQPRLVRRRQRIDELLALEEV